MNTFKVQPLQIWTTYFGGYKYTEIIDEVQFCNDPHNGFIAKTVKPFNCPFILLNSDGSLRNPHLWIYQGTACVKCKKVCYQRCLINE